MIIMKNVLRPLFSLQDAGDKMHVITMGSVAIEVPDQSQIKGHVTTPTANNTLHK